MRSPAGGPLSLSPLAPVRGDEDGDEGRGEGGWRAAHPPDC
jgi:hypothetical protein